MNIFKNKKKKSNCCNIVTPHYVAEFDRSAHQVVLPELFDATWTMDSTEAPESDHSTDTFHECEFCCLLLTTESALQEHRKTHTTPEPVQQEEPVVSIAAADVLASVPHVADPISVSDNEDYEPAPKVPKKRTPSRGKRPSSLEPGERLVCNMCGIVFQVHDALVMHQIEHRKQQEAEKVETVHQSETNENEVPTRSEAPAPNEAPAPSESPADDKQEGRGRRLRQCRAQQENEVRTRQCQTCRKIFNTPEELKYHTPVHSEHGPYCITCCKSFSTATTLARHVREMHASVKLKCEICSKCFATDTGLQEHVAKHKTAEFKKKQVEMAPLQPNQCPVCKKLFQSAVELTHHSPVHAVSEPYCISCDRKFKSTAALTRHVRDNHIKRSATCDVCLKNFANEKNMQEHIVCHDDPNNPFPCKLCDKTFTMQRWLVTHFKHQHRDADISLITDDSEEPSKSAKQPSESSAPKTQPAPSVPSSQTAQYDSSEEEHLDRQKPEMTTCSKCGIKFAKKKGPKSNDTCNMCKIQYQREQQKFECKECQREFQTSAELDDHKKFHVKPTEFPCPQCDCTFSTENYLLAHIHIHKLLGNKHKCWQCDRTFERSHELKRHMDAVHLKNPHYKCLQCPKTFVYSSDYTRHLRIHSGERPFQCPICGKRANASNNLRKHMRSVHGADLPVEFLRGTPMLGGDEPADQSENRDDTHDTSDQSDQMIRFEAD